MPHDAECADVSLPIGKDIRGERAPVETGEVDTQRRASCWRAHAVGMCCVRVVPAVGDGVRTGRATVFRGMLGYVGGFGECVTKGRREVLDGEMGVELQELEWSEFVPAQRVVVFQYLPRRESEEAVSSGIRVVLGPRRIGGDAGTDVGGVVLGHVERWASVSDCPEVLEAVALVRGVILVVFLVASSFVIFNHRNIVVATRSLRCDFPGRSCILRKENRRNWTSARVWSESNRRRWTTPL